jgi:hypothetical protein
LSVFNFMLRSRLKPSQTNINIATTIKLTL